jgi:uncharacterized protein with HEPN domain
MTFTQFEQDVRTQYAVIRAIGIIGEAARSATPEFREQFPNVPWRQMTGMRDRVIHGYDDVELLVIWKTVQEDLPQLISRIEAILNALSAEIEEGDQG